jgi:hypothetical protein
MGGTSDPPERGDDQKINEDLRAGEEVRMLESYILKYFI